MATKYLKKTLQIQDKAQKNKDWDTWFEEVDRLSDWIDLLEEYLPQKKMGEGLENGNECPVSNPKQKTSKRKSLQNKPKDWRSKMFQSCPMDSKFKIPLAVLDLAGVRNSELERGVEVKLDEDEGCISIIIYSTKRGKHEEYGLEWRKLTYELIKDENTSKQNPPPIFVLGGFAKQNGGSVTVYADAKRLSDAVSRLSKKLWPRTKNPITPYSYRHQFAADLKADNTSWEEIAKALGHSVEHTQSLYGSVGQGKKRQKPIIDASEEPKPDPRKEQSTGMKM